MTRGRDRLVRRLVAAVWIGGLALAVRVGIASTDPTQVLGLLVAAYLGGWGLAFALRRADAPPNRLAGRFLLVTLAIAFALGLVELPALVRWVDYRDVFHTPTAAWRRHNHRPDRDLIYLREGNVRERRHFVGGELAGLSGTGGSRIYTSDVAYDAEGFRNARALERADVVVVGDSFVEGLHVADPQLMTSVLARETGLRVANLGRSGDGPQQERFVLERFGLPKRPKVCVWLFYEGNDLEDAAEYEASRAAVASLGPVSVNRTLYERSFLRNALMFARRAWIVPERRRPAAPYQATFPAREGPIVMTFASEDYRRPSDEARLTRAVDPLREADGLCRRQGARLLVALVPTKARVFRGLVRGPGLEAQSESGSLPERLRDALAAASPGAEFLDLAPALREEAERGGLPYFPDDTHWTASGHARAARAIAERLESLQAADRR